MIDHKSQRLFVYGTLLDSKVQLKIICRKVVGVGDFLDGYEKIKMKFTDGEYPSIVRNESKTVEGAVLELSKDELYRCDLYEGEEYKRIKVLLRSGSKAWVYVAV